MSVALECDECGTREDIEPTEDLLWYCSECGSRRRVDADYSTPSETQSDKI